MKKIFRIFSLFIAAFPAFSDNKIESIEIFYLACNGGDKTQCTQWFHLTEQMATNGVMFINDKGDNKVPKMYFCWDKYFNNRSGKERQDEFVAFVTEPGFEKVKDYELYMLFPYFLKTKYPACT